jgi:ribonuclease D
LDTQVAWALLSPEASVSLAYLQFKLLGLRSEKAHQADDWVRRPLQESQLRYAASDVEYLPRMTELLLERARETDRAETLYAASHDTLNPEREPPPPLSLLSFRNAWQLSAKSQAGLRYLMQWYNALPPSDRKRAPDTKALLAVASRCPEDVGALSRIKGVPRLVASTFGEQIVRGLHDAVAAAQKGDFVPLDPPPYATYEEIKLDAWLAQYRATMSVSLGFAPELVLPSRLIKRMKEGLLSSGTAEFFESFVGWRRDFLLSPTKTFCEKSPPPV